MAEQTAEQEPTMEEILASIRRIISEDDEPAAEEPKAAEPAKPEPAPAPAPAPAVAKEKPKAAPPPPPPEPEPEPEEEEVLELTERVDEPAVAEDDEITFDEPEAVVAAIDEGLVSTPVADAAASAFGQLVGQMLVSTRGTEGKTLEDIVRELLKPMLKIWLDQNLRDIVEAAVATEVERISARGRR